MTVEVTDHARDVFAEMFAPFGAHLAPVYAKRTPQDVTCGPPPPPGTRGRELVDLRVELLLTRRHPGIAKAMRHSLTVTQTGATKRRDPLNTYTSYGTTTSMCDVARSDPAGQCARISRLRTRTRTSAWAAS